MNRIIIFFSFIFFCISILNPIHTLPWAAFFSETFAFIAMILLLSLLFKNKIQIPNETIPFLLIALIPATQYQFDQIFFLSNVVLSTIYLLSLWLAIVVGYNLSQPKKIENLSFQPSIFFAYFFVISGVISGVFGLLQWLNLYHYLHFIMEFNGERPYANMAQPNHLATLLNLAVFSVWYLYEKQKVNLVLFILCILGLIFSLCLTQSRTGYLIFLFGFVVIFFSKRRLYLKINRNCLIFSCLYFVFIVVFLPKISFFLSSYFNIQQTSSIVERTTTGYERLKIWNQILHALIEQPWFGYGWNQTTSAQFSVIDIYPGQEWATSAHNLFLDILVWCGLPIGSFIIVFCLWFYIFLYKNISNVESLLSCLVVSGIGIHSLLEYPLFYAYFLIPFGIFLGIALVECKTRNYLISGKSVFIPFVVGLILLFGVCRDYFKIEDNLFAGRLHAMGDLRAKVELPYHLYLLDNYEKRAQWLGLYSRMVVDQDQLENAKKIIMTSLKPYDLYKYAQLMAFNNNIDEALRTLKILNSMYGMNITYHDLIINRNKDGKFTGKHKFTLISE